MAQDPRQQDPRFRRLSPQGPAGGAQDVRGGDPRFRALLEDPEEAEERREALPRGPEGDFELGVPEAPEGVDGEASRRGIISRAREGIRSRLAGPPASERGFRITDAPMMAPPGVKLGVELASAMTQDHERANAAARAFLGHDIAEQAPLRSQLRHGAVQMADVGRQLAGELPKALAIWSMAPDRDRFAGGGLGLGLDTLQEPEEQARRQRIREQQRRQTEETLWKFGELIQGEGRAGRVPDDPRLMNSWLANNLMPGVASMLSFVAVGAVAGPLGAGVLAGTGGQVRAFEEAKELGLSDDEAVRRAMWGTVPGVIQILTPIAMLKGLKSIEGGTLFRQLSQLARLSGRSAVNEMLVNTGGEIGFNIIQDRPWATNWWEAMRDGGAVAFVTTPLLGGPGIGFRRMRARHYVNLTREAVESLDQTLELGLDATGKPFSEKELTEIEETREWLAEILHHYEADLGRGPAREIDVDALPATERSLEERAEAAVEERIRAARERGINVSSRLREQLLLVELAKLDGQEVARPPLTEEDATPAPEAPSLLSRLRRQVGEMVDPSIRAEREAMEQERRGLQRQAETDELTGLPNVRAYNRALGAAEADPNVAVLSIDIDNFKAFNDVFGQEAGDQFLAELAELLRQTHDEAGAGERIFRRGGDEFASFVPLEVAEQVQELVETTFGTVDVEGTSVGLTVGIGQTFNEADAAMKARKEETREAYRPRPTQARPEGDPVELVTQRIANDVFGLGGMEEAFDGPPASSVEGVIEAGIGFADRRDELRLLREVVQDFADTMPEGTAAELTGAIDRKLRSMGRPGRPGRVRETNEGEIPLRETPDGDVLSPVILEGAETEVVTLDGRRLPARYALTDWSQAPISHDPVTWAINPEFPEGIQPRRYHNDPGAQEDVARIAPIVEAEILLDNTISSLNGPPISRRDGLTLSGNSRRMFVLRARALHPMAYSRYLEGLVEHAQKFFPGEDVGAEVAAILAEGGTPGVDRVLVEDITGKAELREFMQAFNEKATKDMDTLGGAAVQAERLRNSTAALQHLEETISPDQTVRDYLSSAAGREFFRLLIQEGVISRAEVGALRTRDEAPTPNARGKEVVERMLLLAAVQDADVVDRAPAGWLRKIEKAVPAIVEAQRAPGFDLSTLLQDALNLGAQVRDTDGARKVVDITGQVDLEGRRWSRESEAVANFLQDNSPNAVASGLREYANLARENRRQSESEDLFGAEPVSPKDAFARVFLGEDVFTAEAVALQPLMTEGMPAEIAQAVQEGIQAPASELRRLLHWGRTEAELQAEAAALWAEMESDPRVAEARTRPQPGDPRDTLSQRPLGDPEAEAYRAERLKILEENFGFRSRERMQAELGVEDHVIRHEKVAVYLVGNPASGKSMIGNPITRDLGGRMIDNDEGKALLDGFENGANAGGVHREAVVLTQRLFIDAVNRGENIVIPTVGKTLRSAEQDGLLDDIEMLKELGYKVHVVMMGLPKEEAARRAYERFRSQNRWVAPKAYVYEAVGDKPALNWPKVKDHPAVISAQRWSNDVARGEPPVWLDQSGIPPAFLAPDRLAREIADRSARSGRRESEVGVGRVEEDPGEVTAPELPLALEVQDDLLGGPPVVTGEAQRDIFPQEAQGLTAAEQSARRTLHSIGPLVEGGTASPRQIEQYREALALLGRNELMSHEEVTARVRQLRELDREAEDASQQTLFPLQPFTNPITRSADVQYLPPWRQDRADFVAQHEGPAQEADALWEWSILEALSEGKITQAQAREQGYEDSHNLQEIDAGSRMYYVTPSRSEVLTHGVRTPMRARMESGEGLGGGDGIAVTVLRDESEAFDQRDVLLLGRAYLLGEVTTEQLLDMAEQGHGTAKPWIGFWSESREELAERLADDSRYSLRFSFLREWAEYRQMAGPGDAIGPLQEFMDMPAAGRTLGNPFGVHGVRNASDLLSLAPSELAVLELEAKEGLHGFVFGRGTRTSIYSGRAVAVVGIDGRQPNEYHLPAEDPSDPGWAYQEIRKELTEQLPLEERTGAELPLDPRTQDLLPDVPVGAREGPDVAPRMSDIIRDLSEIIDRPIRVGRVRKLLNAFGVYRVGPEDLFVRVANDIHAVAHELGHHVHKLLFHRDLPDFDPRAPLAGLDIRPLRLWSPELLGLSRRIGHENLAEGWGEYWRLWLTNKEAARARAPELHRWINQTMSERHSSMWDALGRVQADVKDFYAASPTARVKSRIAWDQDNYKPDRWGRRGFIRVYQNIMDRLFPLGEAFREVHGMKRTDGIDDLPISAQLVPKIMADLVAGTAGMADTFIRHAPLDYKTGRPRTDVKSLAAALAPVMDALTDFESYMVAKRAHHLQTERAIDQGFETSDLAHVLETYEQSNPEFVEAAQDVHDYQEALLDYMVDGGVITRETADAFREGNPFYVPLYKVVDPSMKGSHGTGTGGNDHLFAPFKRIGDSGRDILPPIESIIKNTHFHLEIVQKMKVQAALANMAETVQGAGKWIARIDPAQVIAAKVPKGQLTAWMRKEVQKELLGTPATELNAEFLEQVEALLPELFLVWRPGDFFGEPNVISHLQTVTDPKTGEKKQERVWYRVEPEIYDALTRVPDAARMWGVKALSFPAQTLRVGATTALEFIGRNPFRDQIVAFVQSEYGYTPGIDLMKGIFHILGKTDTYWRWKAAGGEFATMVDMDRDAQLRSIRKMTENPLLNVIKHPFQALQALAATMENATRIAEYTNTIRAGGEKTGMIGRWRREFDPQFREEARARLEDPGVDLMSLAGWNSREISTQYSTHGMDNTVQVLRLLSTFWNARIQSYARLVRAFREDPAGASLRSFMGITVPTIMLYAINRNDDEYWEIPQWQRDWFWLVKVPNFAHHAIPRALTSSSEDRLVRQIAAPFINEGETVWLRFPIPWELGLLFKTFPERALEWMDTDDPEGLQESLRASFTSQVYGTFLPMPTAAEPIIENFANYSFFRQRNIDPIHEGAEPRFIQHGGTSEVAKGLAAMLHGARAYDLPGVESVLGSPQKIDNMLWSYTGGLGRMAVDIIDEGLKRTGVVPRQETRPATTSDVPGVRGFTAREPGLSGESVQRFRRRFREIDRTYQTIRLLEREERWDVLDRELEDQEVQDHLQLWPQYNVVRAHLSRLGALRNQINRDPNMTAEEKIAATREIDREARDLARETIGRKLPGDRFPFPWRRPERE